MFAAVRVAAADWRSTRFLVPAVIPALTARVTACKSGGLTPGLSSAAAARAHASVALCSSVLVTNSRPRSTTMPRNPISTASEIAVRASTPPFWRENPFTQRSIAASCRSPATDVDDRESWRRGNERLVVLVDRAVRGRAANACYGIGVAGCVWIDGLLRLRCFDGEPHLLIEVGRQRHAPADQKQGQRAERESCELHASPHFFSKPPCIAGLLFDGAGGGVPSIFPPRKNSERDGSTNASVGSA